jgi:hypothetical protein
MKVHNLVVTGSLQSGGEDITAISSSVSTTVTDLSSSISASIVSLSSSMVEMVNNMSSSFDTTIDTLATTGSNTFVGDQTISGSLIPSIDSQYDLGSPTNNYRHLYLSSASLYIDGTKVLGSTTQELQITTDTGQSFKILEAGSDTITLQSADGNITLATSGGGDVILDPTNGIVALKGTTTLYAGNKILSSDGNAIQFGNSVTMTGSLIVTGYIETQELRTTYISSSILYRSGSTKFGDESSDNHEFTGSLLVSGSSTLSGNVAMGVGSQQLNSDANLTIRGEVEYVGIDLKSARTSGNIGGFRWYGTTSDSTAVGQMLVQTDGTFSYLNGTNGAEYRMSINTNGNIGIANTSPSYKLDVSGDIRATGNLISDYRLTLPNMTIGYWDSTYNRIESGSDRPLFITAYNQPIYFGRNGSTGDFTLNTDGLIGIGSTSPSGKLTIKGSNDANLLVLENTGGNTAAKFQISENNGLYITSYEGTSDRNIVFGTGTTDRFTITSGGVTVANNLYLAGNTNTRISGDGNGEVGINYSTSNTSTYSLSIYNSSSRVFGVKRDGNINIVAGAAYSQTYTYADSWASGFVDVVPVGTLSNNTVYLFTIWTNSFGQPPYYASASTIITTSGGTNGGGNSPEVDLITASHVNTSVKWRLRMSSAVNSQNGVQVQLLNGPTGSTPSVFVRVTEISSF